MNYNSLQGKIDVLICQCTGNYYKYGMCLYNTKIECKYRHNVIVKNAETPMCEKWSELEKKANGERR